MKMRMIPALAFALLAAACSQPEGERFTVGDEATEAGSRLAPEVQTPIDLGNQAYRAKEYEAALEHYQEATRMAPEEATGWFGVAMAAEALGNDEMATSARAQIGRLAPDLSVSGHTQATDNGHPDVASHPPMGSHP
jgi:tetratricopeptide (TPR) repeat protein